jgi:hypothetical protein
MQPEDAPELCAIRNAAWWVRWYARPHQAEQRDQAINTLASLLLDAAAGRDPCPIVEAIRAVLL